MYRRSAANARNHADLDPKASRFVEVHGVPWERTKFPGVWAKTLLVDAEAVCTAGNSVWRPAGSRHEAHTPNGGLMLAVFQVPNKLFGDDGPTGVLGQNWDAAWGNAANLGTVADDPLPG